MPPGGKLGGPPRLQSAAARIVMLLCVAFGAAPVRVGAQPGYPDPTFGAGGTATASVAPASAAGSVVAIQSDGRIVVAGPWALSVGGDPFHPPQVFYATAVARFLPDGTLDASFGDDGVALCLQGMEISRPERVLIQPGDGKILVVAAFVLSSAQDFVLVRLLPDGTPDATFGSGGVVIDDIGDVDFASDMALDSAGNIVVSGSTGPSAPPRNFNTVVARYLPNGTPDPAFGSNGHIVNDFAPGFIDVADAVAIQADGKIVTAGVAFLDHANASRFFLARFLDDGAVDTSFGSSGSVTTEFNEGSGATELALQADGKLVVAGSQGQAFHPNVAVLRYLTSGILDPDFGDGGKVTIVQPDRSTDSRGLAIQSDGRIVIIGYDHQHGLGFLERVMPDGSRDGSFGSACGVFVTDIVSDLAIQPNGDLVTAVGRRFGAARFLGGSGSSTFCSAEPCAVATKHTLTLARLLAPSGDERVALKGQALLETTAGIDPVTDGVRVIVEDADDATVLDATIASGAYDRGSRIGWKVGGGGTAWTYRNPGSHPQGIRLVGVKLSKSDPRLVKFKVKGQNAAYPLGTLPMRATIVLAPPSDLCIAASWPATPPVSPSCRLRNAATAACK
jgi:uncharacterized delta-60 repeat protein